mgnify:CR=1 FL=1|jgi:pyruvate, water dikinase
MSSSDNKSVLSLADVGLKDIDRVGAKSARLGELMSAGFLVPPGICLTVDCYEDLLENADKHLDIFNRCADNDEASFALLENYFRSVPIEEILRKEIVQFLSERNRACSVAVRSSAVGEDSEIASFAGQFYSKTHLSDIESVLDAIRTCWASVWTRRARYYRKKLGIAARVKMGVLIQEMAPIDWGGVMFTSAIESGSYEDGKASGTRIEYLPGGPGSIVDGKYNPSICHLVRSRRTWKDVVNISASRRSRLPRRVLQQLSATAEQIAKFFSSDQDIEWSLDRHFRLYILQSRPISRSIEPEPGLVEPSTRAEWMTVPDVQWARMSICDSWLPFPLSPLFETGLYPKMVERWAQNWATGKHDREQNPIVPRPMYGTINGYAYLRADFELNSQPIWTLRLIMNWFAYHFSSIEKHWRKRILPDHVRTVMRIQKTELSNIDSQQILDQIEALENIAAKYWASIGGLAWYWNVSEYLLRATWKIFLKSSSERSYLEILAGVRTSAWEMQNSLTKIANADAEDRKPLMMSHIRKFGHLVEQLDFVEPIHDGFDDNIIVDSDSTINGRTVKDPEQTLSMLRYRRDAAIAELKYHVPRPLWPIVLRIVRFADKWARLRDTVIFYFTLPWPRLRQSYMQLGKHLVARGLLTNADQVFFLTVGELRTALEPYYTQNLTVLVEERISLRNRRMRMVPPDCVPKNINIRLGPFNITSLALFGRLNDSSSERRAQSTLFGSAASPGYVEGIAHVARTVSDLSEVGDADILVAPALTPGWAPFLMRFSGVAADLGGVLSHGSIVARELGIPAVTGLGKVTSVVKTGDQVAVDGARGTLRILNRM